MFWHFRVWKMFWWSFKISIPIQDNFLIIDQNNFWNKVPLWTARVKWNFLAIHQFKMLQKGQRAFLKPFLMVYYLSFLNWFRFSRTGYLSGFSIFRRRNKVKNLFIDLFLHFIIVPLFVDGTNQIKSLGIFIRFSHFS